MAWRWCAILAAMAAMLLTGCGERKPRARYRIAVIPKGVTHEFWQSIHRGADRAAADLTAEGVPVEVLWDGPRKEDDLAEQRKLVEQKMVMDIDGLVLAPQHSKLMVRVVSRAVDQGIPVVAIDSGLDWEAVEKKPDLIVKYVATDNYHGGQLAARLLLNVLAKQNKTHPNLVLFRLQVGSESTEQREQGFLDYVNEQIEKQKQAGLEPIKLLDTNHWAGSTVDSAQKEAGPLLNACKDRMDGVFAVNESSATGLLNAMRSQKLNGKVRFVAFDSSDQLRQAVRLGDVDGLIVQDPYRMSYLGVWTMVKHLEGYDVSGQGKTLKDRLYLSTGENVVTKADLDKESVRGLYQPAAQQKRTIARPTFPRK
jgi:ribose transport system substrate-binding protein